MGAIAPIDFEKCLFAPIDFIRFPYDFDNFLLNSVKKGAEKETCTHRLKFLMIPMSYGISFLFSKNFFPTRVQVSERTEKKISEKKTTMGNFNFCSKLITFIQIQFGMLGTGTRLFNNFGSKLQGRRNWGCYSTPNFFVGSV